MTEFMFDKFDGLTYSPYVNEKYKKFYNKYGYIPEAFNPYNCAEITDIAPTLTAQGDSITKSGTVLIVEEEGDDEMRIRKLTPKECFRLMGFEDSDFEKAEAVNSNTQLYKQAGNSIVVPVVQGIIQNLVDCGVLESEGVCEIVG